MDRFLSACFFLISGLHEEKDTEAKILEYASNPGWLASVHLRPQFEFLCHDGQIAVDYLARFEPMESDLKAITAKLGVDQNIELPHLNPTQKRDRNFQPGAQITALIHDIYRQDFEWFNYS